MTSGGDGAHRGTPAGEAHRATDWSTAITATTDERVFIRGMPLDEAIGRESFPAMLLLLWRGDPASTAEAELLGACLLASIDHGPLSPSALVTRTIASTRAGGMNALAGGILSFSEFHGAAVSTAMRLLESSPTDGPVDEWADAVFATERAEGRRLPGIGHRWHHVDLRAERLVEMAAGLGDARYETAIRALAERVRRHSGRPAPINIDGALAVALSVLRLDAVYGDFLFAIARSFGLAAQYVEETVRERPMRTIDPTRARYDGIEPGERPADG